MKLHKTKDKLPDNGQYVLAHLTINNWGEDVGQYWVVAEFVTGISKVERAALADTNKRKKTYRLGDEEANNKKPYYWDIFGPGGHFGQDVDLWASIPKVEPNTPSEFQWTKGGKETLLRIIEEDLKEAIP